jgi:hypothetical protein
MQQSRWGSCRVFIVLLFLALLGVGGCNDDRSVQPQTSSVNVHLQTGFLDTPVRLKLNGVSVFYGRVTTDSCYLNNGLAATLLYPVTQDTCRLMVEIADTLESETAFSAVRTPYVAVGYDSASSRIDLRASAVPLAYIRVPCE